jgi:hypothetical protein
MRRDLFLFRKRVAFGATADRPEELAALSQIMSSCLFDDVE